MSVCAKVGTPGEALLEAYRPRAYAEQVNGRSLASAGCEPILHMRGFQATKQLPPALEADHLEPQESYLISLSQVLGGQPLCKVNSIIGSGMIFLTCLAKVGFWP